jgi:hypothetical protein
MVMGVQRQEPVPPPEPQEPPVALTYEQVLRNYADAPSSSS